jgi:ribonuclease R
MTKFPSPEEISEFIDDRLKQDGEPPARRDIAKAFGLKGPDRANLRRLLSEMEDKGLIALSGKRARLRGSLPPVTVLDITGTDSEGDLECEPVGLDGEFVDIRITIAAKAADSAKPPVGVGDRVLARLRETEPGIYEAKPMKRIGQRRSRSLGVLSTGRRGGMVTPVNRKGGTAFDIAPGDLGGAEDGDLVWVEPLNERGYGPRRARIIETVGDVGASKNWSLVALAENDIPVEFPKSVVAEAEDMELPDLQHHEDLRDLPLITIDPKEAKDHDDAVHVAPIDSGFRITVAIADVSWFVRPGSALDREAEKRGNSVYLVDRVVPMLPERLSNGLCSLRAREDRPALVCEIEIDAEGRKKSHRFRRAMIRCVAGLSYEEAQAAANGDLTARTRDLKESVIDPLYAAYQALQIARARRPSLSLELPERQIVLGEDGSVAEVRAKERMDAHKLIEAFMVLANVCAAETLERRNRPLVYRVHDAPDPERLDGLRQYLDSLGYSLPKGQVMTPTAFNRILAKAEAKDEIHLVSMAVLRTQSQAVYDTDNIGHFGLNLARYAHFTSPIRRYADLTVHRGLVAVAKLGPGGAKAADEARLDKVAEHISDTERRAVSAERSTQDRFLAAYLDNKVGGEFSGRIAGLTRAGLFVNLDETGADGFVPARTLWQDFFDHDEKTQRLVGRNTGAIYRMGQKVRVRLLEATPLQGGLRFEMLTDPEEADGTAPRDGKPRRARRTKAPPKKGRGGGAKGKRPNTDQQGSKAPADDRKPSGGRAAPSKNAGKKKKTAAESGTSTAKSEPGAQAKLKRRPRKPKG